MLPPHGYRLLYYLNSGSTGGEQMTEEPNQPLQDISEGFDQVKRIGFELFNQGKVRRLAQGIYAIKTDVGSYIAENQEGHWRCDCNAVLEGTCPHIYAAQLSRLTTQLSPANSDHPLKCRYCGSPDLRGCGFRYNARGIARRYFCNECRRKFSIKYMGTLANETPSELIWTLNEVATALVRVDDLLTQLHGLLISDNVGNEHPEQS
jgi:hypothetical protein